MSQPGDDGVVLYRTRDGALKAIKAQLQPLYTSQAIGKADFVSAAKACLTRVQSTPAGCDDWTAPGIARIVAAYVARYFGADTARRAESSSRSPVRAGTLQAHREALGNIRRRLLRRTDESDSGGGSSDGDGDQVNVVMMDSSSRSSAEGTSASPDRRRSGPEPRYEMPPQRTPVRRDSSASWSAQQLPQQRQSRHHRGGGGSHEEAGMASRRRRVSASHAASPPRNSTTMEASYRVVSETIIAGPGSDVEPHPRRTVAASASRSATPRRSGSRGPAGSAAPSAADVVAPQRNASVADQQQMLMRLELLELKETSDRQAVELAESRAFGGDVAASFIRGVSLLAATVEASRQRQRRQRSATPPTAAPPASEAAAAHGSQPSRSASPPPPPPPSSPPPPEALSALPDAPAPPVVAKAAAAPSFSPVRRSRDRDGTSDEESADVDRIKALYAALQHKQQRLRQQSPARATAAGTGASAQRGASPRVPPVSPAAPSMLQSPVRRTGKIDVQTGQILVPHPRHDAGRGSEGSALASPARRGGSAVRPRPSTHSYSPATRREHRGAPGLASPARLSTSTTGMTPRRANSPSLYHQPSSVRFHSSTGGRGSSPVPAATGGPTRPQVVEFMRLVLQPHYNSGRLPQAAFVSIVKSVSNDFFGPAHASSWRNDGSGAWQQFLTERLESHIRRFVQTSTHRGNPSGVAGLQS